MLSWRVHPGCASSLLVSQNGGPVRTLLVHEDDERKCGNPSQGVSSQIPKSGSRVWTLNPKPRLRWKSRVLRPYKGPSPSITSEPLPHYNVGA